MTSKWKPQGLDTLEFNFGGIEENGTQSLYITQYFQWGRAQQVPVNRDTWTFIYMQQNF